MNCPRCGHPVTNHEVYGCRNFIGDGIECPCMLTEGDALKAAQRQAAAAGLRKYRGTLTEEIYTWALWDTGILSEAENETAATLLAEWPKSSS